MSTSGPRFDVPMIEDETRPWWDAAREERLLIRRCDGCGRAHLYPRPFCPTCWSDDVRWEQASGDGTLYTWSVVHVNDLPPFKERVPYVAAMVDLAEGPRLESNIIDVDPTDAAALSVGMPLRVSFRHDDDFSVPVFRPA